MKRVGKEPRLLPNVMEAIANLKDRAGSTQKKIIEHVSRAYKRSKDPVRNMTVQIRRALKHGLNSGLIKQRSGKYLLGLDNKDYSVFKKFRKVSDPLSDIVEARRRRRRRGRRGGRRRSRRRGRRRGRRHSDLLEHSDLPSETEEEVFGEPTDRGRRRRRGGRRRRRRRSGRRRRGRRHALDNDKLSDSASPMKSIVDVTKKPEKSKEEKYEECDYQKPSTRHSNREPVNRQPSRHHSCENDGIECGNPECLCGENPDRIESDRYLSNDNNDFYYNDHLM